MAQISNAPIVGSTGPHLDFLLSLACHELRGFAGPVELRASAGRKVVTSGNSMNGAL